VTAELDYAVRALTALAAAPAQRCTVARLAESGMSVTFLQQVLGRLRIAGLLRARRGVGGGYWLAREPSTISVGDIVRALHLAPESAPALHDGDVGAMWLALGAQVRAVLDDTTLADLARVS